MPKKTSVKKAVQILSLEPVYQLWGWILLVWSLYRYFFRFPEWTDELVLKPLIFVGPVLWYLYKKEKRKIDSIGITKRNFFKAFYIGIAFGIVFALEGIFANIFKNGKFTVMPIQALKDYGLFTLFILSFATSITEEILNRGFLFGRIWEFKKNLAYAVLISTLLFVLLHVPALVTTLKFTGIDLVIFFFTNFILSMTNCYLYYATDSLVAPILVHLFWNMTVALYL